MKFQNYKIKLKDIDFREKDLMHQLIVINLRITVLLPNAFRMKKRRE